MLYTLQVTQGTHKDEEESPIPIYVGRSSSYQWFRGGETQTTTKKIFTPRFKVHKGREKYIQVSGFIYWIFAKEIWE